MAGHDWRQWTPAPLPRGPRWRLVRFNVDADGNPVGRAIEATGENGGALSFESELLAQHAANRLNAGAQEPAHA